MTTMELVVPISNNNKYIKYYGEQIFAHLFCYIYIMKSTKLDNDKYYTPKECINNTFNMDYGRIK